MKRPIAPGNKRETAHLYNFRIDACSTSVDQLHQILREMCKSYTFRLETTGKYHGQISLRHKTRITTLRQRFGLVFAFTEPEPFDHELLSEGPWSYKTMMDKPPDKKFFEFGVFSWQSQLIEWIRGETETEEAKSWLKPETDAMTESERDMNKRMIWVYSKDLLNQEKDLYRYLKFIDYATCCNYKQTFESLMQWIQSYRKRKNRFNCVIIPLLRNISDTQKNLYNVGLRKVFESEPDLKMVIMTKHVVMRDLCNNIYQVVENRLVAA